MKKYSINNTTGEILSDLRKNKGLTQKELARIFNVSEGTIAHYEQGITIPNVEILSKFADYFEVTVDYLLGRCLCKMEYTKLNTQLNSNMTLGDMVNIVSSLSKEKKTLSVSNHCDAISNKSQSKQIELNHSWFLCLLFYQLHYIT